MAVLEAGAEEVNDLGEHFEVVSEATDLYAVRDALREADIEVEDTEQDFRSSVEVDLDLDGEFILDGERFPSGRYRISEGVPLNFVTP